MGKLKVNGDIEASTMLKLNGDWETDFGIVFQEGGGTSYGAFIKYGLNDYLTIGTRNNNNDITAIKIYRGDNSVTVNGSVTASSFIGNLSGNATSASSAPWSGITGKPSTFPPSSHTHNYLSWAIHASGTPDFNSVTTTAWNSICAGNTNSPTTSNHGLLLSEMNVGTPFQIWYPDNSMQMWKRYKPSGGNWTSWSNTWEINITGNAATATTASTVAWGNVTGKPSLMSATPGSIELYPGSSAGHGGFIDFHYNNSSSDYTARLINWNGKLQVDGATFNVGGKVELWTDGEGGNIRITSPNGSLWSIDALENSKLRFIWAEAQVPFSFSNDGTISGTYFTGTASYANNCDTVDGWHASGFLRKYGWWTNGNTSYHADTTEDGIAFAYTCHGVPSNWGTLCTFGYGNGRDYNLQLHGTGSNQLFFRNRSSDYGQGSWQRVQVVVGWGSTNPNSAGIRGTNTGDVYYVY